MQDEAEQLDQLEEQLDALLCAGRVGEVDQLLDQVDADTLTPMLMIGYLSATACARDLLPARQRLRERVRLALQHQRGEAYADHLLGRMA